MTKKLAVLFLMAILIVALATALGCGKKAEEGTTPAGAPADSAAAGMTTPAPDSAAAGTTTPAPDTTKTP